MKATELKRKTYVPSDPVPFSGIYQVRHYRHRLPHEATLLDNEYFPACRFCGDQVRFRLICAATSIEHDGDFAEGIESGVKQHQF